MEQAPTAPTEEGSQEKDTRSLMQKNRDFVKEIFAKQREREAQETKDSEQKGNETPE